VATDCHDGDVIEVRREGDNELCGHVVEEDGGWHALTVFGGRLGRCNSYDEAVRTVTSDGLGSLANYWLLSGSGVDGEQIVCIQSASPEAVTVALGYYSLPGVPTLTVSRTELETGRWQLRLS
jgi:hypothetical protein